MENMPEIESTTQQVVTFSSEELVQIMTGEAQRALGAKAIGGLKPVVSYEVVAGHIKSMRFVFDSKENA